MAMVVEAHNHTHTHPHTHTHHIHHHIPVVSGGEYSGPPISNMSRIGPAALSGGPTLSATGCGECCISVAV